MRPASHAGMPDSQQAGGLRGTEEVVRRGGPGGAGRSWRGKGSRKECPETLRGACLAGSVRLPGQSTKKARASNPDWSQCSELHFPMNSTSDQDTSIIKHNSNMNLATMGQTIAGTLLRGKPSLITNKQSSQSEDMPRCIAVC